MRAASPPAPCPRRPSRRASLVLILLSLSIAAGCGYRLQPPSGSRFADPGVVVDLRPFTNASLVPDAGAMLAGRVREEMRRGGYRGSFGHVNADYLVEGHIRDVRDEVVSHGADRFALEHRLILVVDIRVVEVTKGRLLWKEEGIAESASWFAGPDFQYSEANRRTAFEEACRRMARRVGQSLGVIL